MIWVSKRNGKQALQLLDMLGIDPTDSYNSGKVVLDLYEKKIMDSKISRSQKTSK